MFMQSKSACPGINRAVAELRNLYASDKDLATKPLQADAAMFARSSSTGMIAHYSAKLGP